MIATILVPDLLGDSIYTSFFVAKYVETHPDDEVHILLPKATWCDAIWYSVSGVKSVRVWDGVETPTATIDLGRAFGLCVSTYRGEREFWHTISEAHGLNTDDMAVPPIRLPPTYRPMARRTILSPYSASCSSREGKPANKMLSAAHWQAVFDLVHDRWVVGNGTKPLIIGGAGERLIAVKPEFEMIGAPFTTVVDEVRAATVLIGVDTGTVRLANMLGTPAIYTTPVGLGKMFMPEWGGKIAHETGDPSTYQPERFRTFVEEFLNSLQADKKPL